MKFHALFRLNWPMLLSLGLLGPTAPSSPPPTAGTTDPWAQVQTIEKRLIAPQFPTSTWSILDQGAVADGRSNAQTAIQAAIDACHRAGGGRVLVPAGNFFSDGPLRLRSNVNLHLAAGAYLRFGVNPARYTPLVKVRWEGVFCYNYSPLIYAQGQKNLAITGEGTLDGQAAQFWQAWKRDNQGQNQEADKVRLRQQGNDGVPLAERIYGHGQADLNGDGIMEGDGQPHYLRPSLVAFLECDNILLAGFTAQGSPFWTIHPVLCRNVIIRGLHIKKGTTNDDGIDPDSCTDVLIEDCAIHTNDDPISIKAGRDQDGWRYPGSSHLLVRNCTVSSEVGNGFCIGSEMSGGVSAVYVQNYRVLRTDNGINFKGNLDRGGSIQQVYLRHLQIDSCAKHGILFQMDYHGYRGGNFPPEFASFALQDITIGYAGRVGIAIKGVANQPVKTVDLRRIRVENTPQPYTLQHVQDLRVKHLVVGGRPIQLSENY